MDSVNLKTASAYLNNLLLARGLLRNGKAIQFARPHKGEGGTEATMAQIINLVHDMVLRRDREQEQRESLAQTIRTLRTDSTDKTVSLDRLQTKYDDIYRQHSLIQAQEKSARAACRTAEAAARGLREELARLKASVQQIRASCANDVRKRDLQIQKLKTYLTSQQRGNRSAPVAATISITPGPLGMHGTNLHREDSPIVEDPEYSLRQETTEFLTQLSQSLSDENDNLIGMIRSTLTTLKELQGLPENAARAGLPSNGISEDQDGDDKMLQALPISYDALSSDMDHVLDNLRNLLTNPNFVPIEEVAMREEEISKLRSGWDQMEMKWKEAIIMMDGWRKRMLQGGESVNVEEIKRGLGLGRDLNIRNAFSESLAVHEPTSDTDDESVHDDSQDLSSILDDELAEARTGPTLQGRIPTQKPLIEVNGNHRSPRQVNFRPQRTEVEGMDENATENQTRKDGRNRKRHSDPEPHPDERSAKMTVQEKLNVAQAEAEAAAVAAGLNLNEVEVKAEVQGIVEVDITRHIKKTKISGRPRRRKSTLTPDELEKLMYNNS